MNLDGRLKRAKEAAALAEEGAIRRVAEQLAAAAGLKPAAIADELAATLRLWRQTGGDVEATTRLLARHFDLDSAELRTEATRLLGGHDQ